MKTVNTAKLSYLRNAEYYLLIKSTLGQFHQSLTEELKFEALIKNLSDSFGRYEDTYLSNQSSILTPEIQQADRDRDNYFIGLGNVVKGFERLGNEAEKRAAAVISHAMRPYHSTPKAPTNENTAQLKAFIFDMSQGENRHHIETLKLSGRISELENLNANFEDLLHARAENRTNSEGVGKLVDLRKEIDVAYRAVIDRVNALYMIAYQDKDEEKEPVLSELIDRINLNVRLVQEAASRREGRRKNAKEKKEGEVSEGAEGNKEEEK